MAKTHSWPDAAVQSLTMPTDLRTRILLAAGALLFLVGFATHGPASVGVLDLGVILIWSGFLFQPGRVAPSKLVWIGSWVAIAGIAIRAVYFFSGRIGLIGAISWVVLFAGVAMLVFALVSRILRSA